MPETNNSPTVNVNPVQGEDSQPVLAYRVGQLEKASKEGFESISKKLEQMSANFATHKDIEVAKEQARLEHEAVHAEIGTIRDDVQSLKKKTWIQNTLSAILGAILAFLISYAANGIFK